MDLLDSEREIRRLRKAIADRCTEGRNSHANGEENEVEREREVRDSQGIHVHSQSTQFYPKMMSFRGDCNLQPLWLITGTRHPGIPVYMRKSKPFTLG